MKAEDPDRLSRREIASRVGCSVTLVVSWQKLGILTPKVQSNGIVTYPISEVEAHLAQYEPNARIPRRKPEDDALGKQLRKVLIAMKRGIQSVPLLILETGVAPAVIAYAFELDGLSAKQLSERLKADAAAREEKLAKKKRDREAFIYERMRFKAMAARGEKR